MKLTVSQLKYILVLGNNSGDRGIRTVDIAKKLSIQRSSAFNMLNKLSEEGLVIKSDDKMVSLTEQGKQKADSLCLKVRDTVGKLQENFGLSGESAEDCALMIISCSEDI